MFSDEVHKFSGEVHKFSDEVHKFSDVKHKIHFVSKSFLTGFNYLPTKPATTTFKILAGETELKVDEDYKVSSLS